MSEPPYHSYLLRLWQEGVEKKSNWRFILVNLANNEEQGFASLERLVTYLQEQMDEISVPGRVGRDKAKHSKQLQKRE